jgi:hypothetical protein
MTQYPKSLVLSLVHGLNGISLRRKTVENMILTARDHVCECGGVLTVAWLNDGWALRCGNDKSHNAVKRVNPLMKHVSLIAYNKGKQNESWAIVLGIKASRLIVSRRHNYSYIDGTPRMMTEEEQKKILGEIDTNNLQAITILKDESGNLYPGYGHWPKGTEPYGVDKGNSKANMAFIRSERQALDKMDPGALPQGVEVIDEEYTPAPATRQVKTEVVEPEKEQHRDPSGLKTFGELCQFCYDEWKMMPRDILAECNVTDSKDIPDFPAAARNIAAVRG